VSEDPVVVDGARTAIGKFGGVFSTVDSFELAGQAISSALERSAVAAESVDEVVMGQVGSVGADAYNARRCSLAAGLPASTTAMNVNRLCGSGLQAIITGAHQILLCEADIVVAGGNESMSRQPFLDFGARVGWALGTRELIDGTVSLITDPWGRYGMGETAERVADRFGVSRHSQMSTRREVISGHERHSRAASSIAKSVPSRFPLRASWSLEMSILEPMLRRTGWHA